MTQEQTDTPMTLSDIAAEIGFALDEVELPQEDTAAEAAEETAEVAEETDTEDPAEADLSQTDSEEEEEQEQTEEEKNPVPEKLLRRIDKLTAKRREAEERADTLETEVSDLRAKLDASTPVQIIPSPSDPLADVETPDQLEERIAQAKKIRTWAMRNLEGATVQNAAGEDVYYEPSQVRDYLANADDILTEHAPKRKEWLASRGQVIGEAKVAYPALFKTGTPEHDMYRSTLRTYPSLKSLPNLEMIIGDAIEGQKLRFARAEAAYKKSASPESKPSVKSSAPPSPAKGAKVSAKDIATREGAKNIYSRASTLKSDDIAAYLEGAL